MYSLKIIFVALKKAKKNFINLLLYIKNKIIARVEKLMEIIKNKYPLVFAKCLRFFVGRVAFLTNSIFFIAESRFFSTLIILLFSIAILGEFSGKLIFLQGVIGTLCKLFYLQYFLLYCLLRNDNIRNFVLTNATNISADKIQSVLVFFKQPLLFAIIIIIVNYLTSVIYSEYLLAEANRLLVELEKSTQLLKENGVDSSTIKAHILLKLEQRAEIAHKSARGCFVRMTFWLQDNFRFLVNGLLCEFGIKKSENSLPIVVNKPSDSKAFTIPSGFEKAKLVSNILSKIYPWGGGVGGAIIYERFKTVPPVALPEVSKETETDRRLREGESSIEFLKRQGVSTKEIHKVAVKVAESTIAGAERNTKGPATKTTTISGHLETPAFTIGGKKGP